MPSSIKTIRNFLYKSPTTFFKFFLLILKASQMSSATFLQFRGEVTIVVDECTSYRHTLLPPFRNFGRLQQARQQYFVLPRFSFHFASSLITKSKSKKGQYIVCLSKTNKRANHTQITTANHPITTNVSLIITVLL